MNGYGVFWSIIEDLYNNANALQTDYEGIAYDLRMDEDVIKSIINDFDLFVIDGAEFGSMSVQRRLDERAEKSARARDSANKRWGNDANAMRPQSEGNAIKERKVKEIKESKGKDVIEALSYFNELTGKKIFTEGERSKPNKKLIENLLQHSTVEDIKKVIELKKYQWGGDPKMAEYLRPSTLFRKSNFIEYLQEVNAIEENPDYRKLINGKNGSSKQQGTINAFTEAIQRMQQKRSGL